MRPLRLPFLLLFVLTLGASFGLAPVRHAGASGRAAPSLCARPSLPSPSGRFPRVLQIGPRSVALATSQRTGHAFVALSGRNGIAGSLQCRSSVTTLDAATGRPLRTVAVGAVPPVIAVDDRDGRVFVTGYVESQHPDLDHGSLTALDLQGRVVLGPRTFGLCPCAQNGFSGPIQIRVDGLAHRVFVLTYRSALTIDALTGRLLNTVPVVDIAGAGGLPGFAVDERLGRVFIATGDGITVLDARTGSLAQTVDLGKSERGLAEDSRTGRIFVTANKPNTGDCRGAPLQTMSTVDAATGKVLRGVLGSCNGFSPIIVDEPAQQVLVGTFAMSPGITRFAVLNSKNGGVLRSLNADSSGLRYTAVDPSNGRIYYATQVCTGKTRAATHCRDAVKTLNPEGWRIVRTVPVAHAYQGILAVAARAHRVLIASPSSGTVTILQI